MFLPLEPNVKDGCFWHGCPRHATRPAANRRRDRLVTRTLRRLGWRVVRIWEHEIESGSKKRLLARLRRAIGPAADQR